MFPRLWNETKDLAPEVFFGLSEVPPYQKILFTDRSMVDDVLDAILQFTWDEGASGYVEKGSIFFHRQTDSEILVDLSKEFVFISQPQWPEAAYPSAWQVLRFLQEPVKKALFIGQGAATQIEKSENTLELCKHLDLLWSSEFPVEDLTGAVSDQRKRSCLLATLMKMFEEVHCGESSEMWHFWETFRNYLMISCLGIEITEISIETDD